MMKLLTGNKVLAHMLLKLFSVSFIIYLLAGSEITVSGQTNGDYRTRGTGNWNSNTVWQVYSGGVWVNCAAGDYPGAAPGAGTVDILDNNTVTVTANVPNNIGSLRINGGTNDSYLQFNAGVSLAVTGETYLNSNSNNDEKSILVDAGNFTTGSVNANSNGDTRDAYITISTGNVTVTGSVALNSTNLRTYVLFTGNGNLYVRGSMTGGTITGTAGGGASAPSSGTVIYNGIASQNAGTYTYYNLTVNNPAGVSLSGSFTVNNLLTLSNGSFAVGGNTITLNGPTIAGTPSNLSTTSSSSLVFGGTSAGVLIPTSVIALDGLSITNTSIVTLQSALTVNGTFNPAGAGLSIGANTLTLNGQINCGTLAGGATSSIIIGGSGSANLPGVTLNNLTVNRAVTMCGNVTTGGTLTLTSGVLSIAANTLTLSNAASLSYGAGSLTGGTTSNLTIGTGTAITLSAISGGLNNFNVSRNVTLAADLSLNGTLTLTAGTFSVAGNTLTLNGPTIAGTPSNLSTTSSSSLVFGGTSAGVQIPSSVANLNNLTVNNSLGITLAGNVTVAGGLTMTQGNTTTGANILIISNSAAGSINRTSGTIVGRLSRVVNTPLSTDYLFPVGTAAYYRPAVMNFSSLSAGTSITAEFIATPPGGLTSYTDDIAYLNNTFTEGYWRFISSGLPAANYSLKLTGDGFTSYAINQLTRITGRDNGNTTWRALGVHGTRSGNDVSRTGITNLNTTSFDFAFATGCNLTLMGYGYERNITIDYTKVSGGSDLYNFPVLIYLTGQNFLKNSPAGEIFNTNGYDIIFTDNNYNKLDHQLEYYNGTNGDLIAWIRIPTLSCSANSVIKILYGNIQVNTNPSVTSVWDSHYKGVWHLDDNNLNDFTSFNIAGTPYNTPSYQAGVINNALGLNGTNEYVQVNNDPNINFAGNITVSAWVYMNANNRDQKIAGNQNNSSGGYKFGIYTNNKVEFEIRNSANTPSLNRDVTGGTVLSVGQWYYLAGISSDVLDSIKTFVNGLPERPFKKTGILGVASDNLVIGKEPFQSLYYFSGMFDELRISNRVRSNGWLRTEYNNQSSPSTFYSVDAAAVTNNLPSASLCDVPVTLTFGYPTGGAYSGNPFISGNVFTPPSAGTYSITYTYDGGCGPISVTKNIIITGIPGAPSASNKEFCSNQITYLEATSGVNIRWYNGGTLVSTANPFSTGQTAAGTYNYTVTQTVNGCESPATSVTMTIYGGITVNAQPQPLSICAGDNAVFSVSATGLNLSYRWQEDGVNISDGGIYSGSATPVLTLTNPGITKNGKQYRCVISASCGSSPVNSNAALLTVTIQPVATFSYTGTPYCPNAANPFPTFSGGGIAGIFSSSAGLIFINTATGEVNLGASTPGSYTVTNTIAASGGCAEAIATSPISIISDITWTGAVSTDWNTTGNWSCGLVPTSLFSAQIPDVSNEPVLGAGASGTVNNLTIDAGSSLTITDNTLQIAGTITSNGTFTVSGGSIEMISSVAQNIGANTFAGNSIKNLTINNSSGVALQGSLNITGILSVQNGSFSSGGNLTLTSTAVQTALIDGAGNGTVTGNVTMQRFLPAGFGYKYFSSPFQAATVSEFGDDMDLSASFPTFYRYNEASTTSGWADYTDPAGALDPLRGYAVNFGSSLVPNTVEITGVVNNGSISTTLFNNNNTYTLGFNLVGNPYPSPINWDASPGWTKTNIDDAIYYFKASTTDEYGGTYSSYINKVSSDGLATALIPSMQGFFIHVSNGTYPVTATFGLDNNVRITDLTHPFMKSDEKGPDQFLRLSATYADDTTATDPMVVYFNDKATTSFDKSFDALKLLNTDFYVPNFYSFGTDGSKLSINALPPLTTGTLCQIPLGLKLNMDGTIIFRITDLGKGFSGYRVNITDMASGVQQELLDNGEYEVFLNAGEYPNRFFLNLSASLTGVLDTNPNELFTVYATHGLIKMKIGLMSQKLNILTISNLMGQLLLIKKDLDPGYHEINPGLKDGIYIVTFASGNFRSSKKIIIQNQ